MHRLKHISMESKFKQFIDDNKGFAVFYLIWFLIHLIFVSFGEGNYEFWPFSNFEKYYASKG